LIALDIFLAFVAATALLTVIPGPNVAQVVAHGRVRYRLTGRRPVGAGVGLAFARRS
jgi:threonine/homoserine/homoserine lactone efflux protein